MWRCRTPERYETTSRSVLLGIVPAWMHPPPTSLARSTTATVRPSLAAAIAVFWPAGPVPRTTRSYRLNRLVPVGPDGAARHDAPTARAAIRDRHHAGGTRELVLLRGDCADSAGRASRRSRQGEKEHDSQNRQRQRSARDPVRHARRVDRARCSDVTNA